MKSQTLIGVAALSFLALMSCEMKKQLGEMHDSTQRLEANTQRMGDTTEKMQKTTQTMSETTQKMSGTTEEMNERTAQLYESTLKMLDKTTAISGASSELYDAIKQGDTLNLRRQALATMLAAESNGRKISEAVKYVLSFEFQVFSGQGQDVEPSKREHLMVDALAEFYKDLKEYAPVSNDIDPLAQASSGSEANKKAVFNAVAAVLHKANRKQEEFLRANPKYEKVTFLSMIENGLKKAKALKEGAVAFSQLSESEKEVISNEKISYLLLQARHNFIAAILLSESSSVQRGLLTVLKMMTLGWDLKLSDFNQVQMTNFVSYIQAIQTTRTFLKSQGQVLVLDFKLMRLLKMAKIIKDQNLKLKNPGLFKIQNKFEQDYKSLIKSS